MPRLDPRRASLAAILALVLEAALASSASAHTVMVDPPPRDPDQIKIAPCGGAGPTSAGGAQRTVLEAGSTITVRFAETVQHPGYFRIAFSPDGLTGFDQHILVPMIADTGGADYAVQVHLPSTPCDHCSLQVIQCMDGSLPPIAECSNYYSCSDVILTGPGGEPGAADAGPGSADGASSDPGGAPAEAPSLFGCTIAPHAPASPWLVVAALLGCFEMRRRRRRRT
jgi:MYXO-CTERM domain-containing protein